MNVRYGAPSVAKWGCGRDNGVRGWFVTEVTWLETIEQLFSSWFWVKMAKSKNQSLNTAL